MIRGFHSHDHTYRIILKIIDSWVSFLRPHLPDHIENNRLVGFILTTPFIGPHENITIRGFHSDEHTYHTMWKYIDLWVSLLRPHLSDHMEIY